MTRTEFATLKSLLLSRRMDWWTGAEWSFLDEHLIRSRNRLTHENERVIARLQQLAERTAPPTTRG